MPTLIVPRDITSCSASALAGNVPAPNITQSPRRMAPSFLRVFMIRFSELGPDRPPAWDVSTLGTARQPAFHSPCRQRHRPAHREIEGGDQAVDEERTEGDAGD